MPNRDKTGPDGKGQPGRGLGPCSSRKRNKEADSDRNDYLGGFNKRKRGKKG